MGGKKELSRKSIKIIEKFLKKKRGLNERKKKNEWERKEKNLKEMKRHNGIVRHLFKNQLTQF